MADWQRMYVVGSGVGEAWPLRLGRAGVKVAVYEAGRHYDPEIETR